MKDKFDYMLLILTLVLVFFGLIMVYSASAVFSERSFNDDPFHIFKNQLTWTIIGLLILVITVFIPVRLYERLAWIILGLTIASLALVFIPGLSVKVLGAKRWVSLLGVSFQPSELAKVAVIIFLARLLKDENRIEDAKLTFFPGLIVLSIISALVIFEPDFGTSMEIFILGMIVMFIAGIRFLNLAAVGAALVPIAGILILLAGYRKERILAFIDPHKLSSTSGYQIIQSLIAIGSGGVSGTGLGNSIQKLFFLPQAHSDYIFAIIGEELGFIGSVFVLILFFLLLLKGFRIARNAEGRFEQLLAFGITFHILLQTFLNIGITLGLLPPKGLPLPFFSAGGSSLIITLFEIGILLRISFKNELDKQYGR
ncbi:MAG: putative lipid II flippase FtsW [bacterium]|nr:putative lipid II flippase FtsW [bacterium]